MYTTFWFINSLILLLMVIYCFHKYMSRNYNYWKKKNVFYIKPVPIVGNFLDILLCRIRPAEFLAKLYNKTKEPVFGIFVFDKPFLVLKNPDIIKSVLIRDFNYFNDRSILSSPYDPITAHMLFVCKNPEWKTIRMKLTPLFTSGKLKNFVPYMVNQGKNVVKYIEKNSSSYSNEAKEICAKYTTDVLVKYAFGFNANSIENENADFRRLGRKTFVFTWSNAIQRASFIFLPTLAKIFRMQMIHPEITSFLRKVFWETIDQREKYYIKENDFIDLMIKLRQNTKFCEKFNFGGDKIVAQASQFFIAGSENTSSTMALTLYELCLAPEIQQRLRNEIKNALQKNNDLTYEVINNMKYLHMVVCETLRKYPALPFLDRKCNTDYKIPGTDITIEKDTPVFIPMVGIHYDKEYFPNPQIYNPERFSPEYISSLPSCTYIPFGEGPRNCIGERFGLLITKIGLISILSEFEVERSTDTPVPIRIVPRSFILTSDVGLPMKFRRCVSSASLVHKLIK